MKPKSIPEQSAGGVKMSHNFLGILWMIHHISPFHKTKSYFHGRVNLLQRYTISAVTGVLEGMADGEGQHPELTLLHFAEGVVGADLPLVGADGGHPGVAVLHEEELGGDPQGLEAPPPGNVVKVDLAILDPAESIRGWN